MSRWPSILKFSEQKPAKGVMIQHDSIVSLVRSFDTRFPFFNETWRMSQASSLAVDYCFEDIWAAWSVGARFSLDIIWLGWLCPLQTTYLKVVQTLFRAFRKARLYKLSESVVWIVFKWLPQDLRPLTHHFRLLFSQRETPKRGAQATTLSVKRNSRQL